MADRRNPTADSTRRPWSRHAPAFLLCFSLTTSAAARQELSGVPLSCATLAGEGVDLRCSDLEPTATFEGASGRIELSHAQSPFGIAVAPDGTPRYNVRAIVDGLPLPKQGGFVAWLVDEYIRPVARLGELRNGTNDLGSIALNKFRILVSLEDDLGATVRSGPLALRAESPSSRLQGHDFAFASPLAAYGPRGGAGHVHGAHADPADTSDAWRMPPMKFDLPMPPGMLTIAPDADPWLPDNTADIPPARPQSWMKMSDGDTLRLTAKPIRRRLHSREVVMYGFNGEFPGPLVEVDEAATLVVDFRNELPMPTAVHWHGIRLENRFDGVPGVTQEAVEPGGRFEYRVHFPDAGLYWYHPHHREDIFQDMGLYGNLLVRPKAGSSLPFDGERVLLLDDVLLADPGGGDEGFVPYGYDESNFTLMGRFGNVMLVNGEPDYRMDALEGEVLRLYLTNVSNTRTFNLRFADAEVVVVGSDLGFFEWATPVSSVVIGPAERYIVDVRFLSSGEHAITNAVQALDHISATYFPVVDTLGFVDVGRGGAGVGVGAVRDLTSRVANQNVRAEMAPFRERSDGPVDRTLELTLRVRDLPPVVEQLMRSDRVYFSPVEWEGTMPVMNWASTSRQVEWVLRDPATGLENMAMDWRFEVGEVVRVRVVNDRDTFHAMQHPLHIHGQRFLVMQQNGEPNENLVWKDTVLLPAGSTTDLLLELSNPGDWMVHCHIAEHLESGMKMVFRVGG